MTVSKDFVKMIETAVREMGYGYKLGYSHEGDFTHIVIYPKPERTGQYIDTDIIEFLTQYGFVIDTITFDCEFTGDAAVFSYKSD